MTVGPNDAFGVNVNCQLAPVWSIDPVSRRVAVIWPEELHEPLAVKEAIGTNVPLIVGAPFGDTTSADQVQLFHVWLSGSVMIVLVRTLVEASAPTGERRSRRSGLYSFIVVPHLGHTF